MAREIGMVERVALRRAVALAVGQVFEDGRDGFCSASSGSQIRAESTVPSDSGMSASSMTRIGWRGVGISGVEESTGKVGVNGQERRRTPSTSRRGA